MFRKQDIHIHTSIYVYLYLLYAYVYANSLVQCSFKYLETSMSNKVYRRTHGSGGSRADSTTITADISVPETLMDTSF